MRYVTLLTTVVATVFLGSCAKHAKDYVIHSLIHSQKIALLVVPEDASKKGQNHYSVPMQLRSSLISQKKLAAMQSSNEQSSLIMSNNIGQAWTKIERALQKTPYQIVDQDSSLSSFYILDIKSTNNNITKATPIYRIYLKSRGNQTQVILLNKNNQPAAKDVTQRILSVIQEKMA